ncbi:SIP domain-containing protein [Leucobacter sp. UT-8R-CII-1-4]|uniref:SIP domain-containing protein n=1 Tax=Leucobacter sp. UT-8R-CII-1-4 TaxID=3040075 RepID=UPI0024A9BB07|nr:SIP domain-containing protein [Leucobacter sp. UT-8R-CII-1-4]MDI6022349.1 SIP domain-containing protein [Leucobacter sp. UT-8R-CII-1-4]
MNENSSHSDDTGFEAHGFTAPATGDELMHDHGQLDCILAAGDIGDLPGLRAWCENLPIDSYGQVFIEVFSPIQIEPIHTPPGVNVTWICRERLRESTRPGIGIPRCEALATAVDAWLDEWFRVDSCLTRHFTMWMGARGSSIMHSYWLRIEREVAAAQRSSHSNS